MTHRFLTAREQAECLSPWLRRAADDSHVTVYHGTDNDAAESILRDGFRPGWGGHSYFTTHPQSASSYGDALLGVDLPRDVYERSERHQWSGDETVMPRQEDMASLRPRRIIDPPRIPLGDSAPVHPKLYRQNDQGGWDEGTPADDLPHHVDEESLETYRSLPDWPAGTFDDGVGTYWDVDFGDGPRPVHQRHLHSGYEGDHATH
ncbi:hypothetical protein SEA_SCOOBYDOOBYDOO_114 [Mycobacterium phage ScoobyDoobyDoo]|nr:hypothetical protein SEA_SCOOBYDOOBYDOO_114 [Mycobacterium phage ScoobyDoobyDoo]